MPRVCVLGAGVVGLSVALNIQRSIPGAAVHIIADCFHPDTTSNVAAGIFRPTKTKTPGVPMETLMGWLRDSWAYYDRLAHGPDAGIAGVQKISGYYYFTKEQQEEPLFKDIVYDCRPLTSRELNLHTGPKVKSGWFCTTLLTQSDRYLPYLTKKIEQNGGTFEKRHINSMQELVGLYDVVANCTAVGSRTLLNDDKVVANRGQVIKVKAPWQKHFVYVDDLWFHAILGVDNVVLGGTDQLGDWDKAVRPRETDQIWNRTLQILPSMKDAEIIKVAVGLRPFRDPLRLEKEVMKFGNNSLKVVHNYGHGAEGVSLSWATAVQATKLVKELLNEPATSAKL